MVRLAFEAEPPSLDLLVVLELGLKEPGELESFQYSGAIFYGLGAQRCELGASFLSGYGAAR